MCEYDDEYVESVSREARKTVIANCAVVVANRSANDEQILLLKAQRR